MLKNGKYIKEPPVEIGKFWQPAIHEHTKTPEERMVFALVMGYKLRKDTWWSRLVGMVLGF